MTWCEYANNWCDADPERCLDCSVKEDYLAENEPEYIVVSNRTITKLSLSNMDFSS